MEIYDAHNHAHFLARENLLRPEQLRASGLTRGVVNGTRESDWEEVLNLCQRDSLWVPAIGLHPWYVGERSDSWEGKLRELASQTQCGIGEIGLDRWIQDFDWEGQQSVFVGQLKIAVELDRPVSIHCLKAWGRLLEILQAEKRTRFLLHSYGGPAEMIESFVELGAYFSFSGYFAHPRKSAARELFRVIPLERLLIETDAPDMLPPPELNPFPLFTADGKAQNNPANIMAVYRYCAELRGIPLVEFTERIAENFRRLFGALAAKSESPSPPR
jgi:TatD DNase family protein